MNNENLKALKSGTIAITLLVATILTTQQLEVQADNDNDNDPNPYCDVVRQDPNYHGSCHDRKDNSETTGLYTCNDGTHKADWRDCKDATTTDGDD